MQSNRKGMTLRERAILRRCLVLMAGSILFFLLAGLRARGGELSYRDSDPWILSAEEEDEYDVMSDDDHIAATRLRRLMLGDGNHGPYNRRKASRVHDSVTIVVKETTKSELASANDLSRDSSNDMTLNSWLTPKLSGGLGLTQRGAAANGKSPTISYTNKREHSSDSTIERSQSLTTTITGEVIEVQRNGYLVVEARKTVNVNGEEQTVKVTGIVNPEFMDSNSAIKAELLMDMSVAYVGKGPMTRMDKRGWGAKAIDFLNPF
ncbi:MAG: flagellar basal body L-ring protein FlgH [Planctomycetota bacterium]|jgi:flagellar L-ring protein precursor FlgH|nr:flagellar basal body L-ring protein FlgH [Planctomycetota bacterium]